MEERYIVYEGGTGEVEEKKSKFIAAVHPVETEEAATAFINKIKKQYWDAKHNCFAYIIGDRQQIKRCSDDGEPSGTAGKPMLDVLTGKKLHNVVVVVTRYFGGTLLGTGGLVRAYSKSTQAGLENSVILEKCAGSIILLETDYNGIGKVQYIVSTMNVNMIDTQYTDKVSCKILVPEINVCSFKKKVTEATSGKALMHIDKKIYYGLYDKDVVIL